MKRTASFVLATCALAACAHGPAPSPAPAPANGSPSAVPRDSTRPAVGTDSALAHADSLATRADSVAVSDSDVTTSASKMFGDSAVTVDSAAPTWDIDVRSYETRDRVQRYVSLFTGSARGRIVDQLERGTRYESMIRGAFRNVGLPEDMYYLGLIESGYNPNAYSKAAAVGMWQFMTGTARGMGLRVDWWIDERRDP
ncbi:MAG: transglycosylase SLT domain-containing protein, partial [Gemmatimonadaceae bacterium]